MGGGSLPQGGLPRELLPHLAGKFSTRGNTQKQHHPVHQAPVLVLSPNLPWFRDLGSVLPRAPPRLRLQKGAWPPSVRPPGAGSWFQAGSQLGLVIPAEWRWFSAHLSLPAGDTPCRSPALAVRL